ncbi:hypothetical protein [Agreia sp. COWG]|uniref:hypothetical protein n=1 Tax=Agreia sp. COWG TaxID=2773266 RepID=UPI001925D133|nr:hypothetical protein [Agreia sp. COWG]CAD5998523.1 conserved protein of unknown function [Agreia sp. COWG]
MNKVLWLTAGIATGFALAHLMNQTPEGRTFFSKIDSRAKGFTESVADGYRERETELRAVLSETTDTLDSDTK